MRRNALALAIMLFLGQLFVVAAPAEPASPAQESVVRHSPDAAHLPGAAPKPHNHQAALVPLSQLPADVPPVAKPAMPVRLVMSFARRLHRTPESVHSTPMRDRSPPSGR